MSQAEPNEPDDPPCDRDWPEDPLHRWQVLFRGKRALYGKSAVELRLCTQCWLNHAFPLS